MINLDHQDSSELAFEPGSAEGRSSTVGGSGLADVGPTWRLYGEYWQMVRRHVPARSERLRCYACLVCWPLATRNGIALLRELLDALDRRVRAAAGGLGHGVSGGARVVLANVAQQRLGHR